MRRLAVLAGVLLLAALAPSPAVAPEAPCGPVVELPGVGLACPDGPGFRLLLPQGGTVLVHGGDPAPPEWVDALPLPPFRAPPACVDPTLTPGPDAYGVLVYARPFDQPDRYAEMAPQIRNMFLLANTWLFVDALQDGVPARYKMLCSGQDLVVVDAVLPTPRARTHPGSIFGDVIGLGHASSEAKYWVWFDGPWACGCAGLGTVDWDDRPEPRNANNGGPDWGINFGYGGGFGAFVMMHENGHNQGAVQISAPHSSGGFHCNDGQDVMCYPDGGPTSNYDGGVCQGSHTPLQVVVWDCHGDDYFNTAPQPGTYILSHWNLGSPHNKFMAVGA